MLDLDSPALALYGLLESRLEPRKALAVEALRVAQMQLDDRDVVQTQT